MSGRLQRFFDLPGQIDLKQGMAGYILLVGKHLELFKLGLGKPERDGFHGGFEVWKCNCIADT